MQPRIIAMKLKDYFMYNSAASFDINVQAGGFVIYNNKRFTKKESSNK